MSESKEVNLPAEERQPHGPVSAKKLAANRRNAQLSTGPRTAQGKAAIRWNALKHGLLAKEVVVKIGGVTELPKAFQRLFESLVEDLQPVGVLESICVERIAVAYWRLRRVLRSEAGEICRALDTAETRAQDQYLTLADQLRVWLIDVLPKEVAAEKNFSDETLQRLDRYCVELKSRTVGSVVRGADGKILTLALAVQARSSALAEATVPSEQQALRQQLSGAVEALVKELESREKTSEFTRDLLTRDLMKREMEIEEAAAAIPERNAVERLARYETMVTRELDRRIDQLERLQRRRREEDFAKQSHRARPGSTPAPTPRRAVTDLEVAVSALRVRSTEVSATG